MPVKVDTLEIAPNETLAVTRDEDGNITSEDAFNYMLEIAPGQFFNLATELKVFFNNLRTEEPVSDYFTVIWDYSDVDFYTPGNYCAIAKVFDQNIIVNIRVRNDLNVVSIDMPGYISVKRVTLPLIPKM